MGYADDLLDQARALAKMDRHRPKQANVRRAISAAYYALFHEVAERAAASILPGVEAAGPVGWRLRRTIQHSAVLRAAKWFAGPPTTLPPALRNMRRTPRKKEPPIDPRLARFCQVFADLQAERHRADYDLTSPFARAEVKRRISDASAATDALRSLPSRGDTLIFFLGCLLGDALTRNA